MLQSFSQHNPKSVTTKAVLQPKIAGVVVYGANTGLSYKTCDIAMMRRQNSRDLLANIWTQWKETDETFCDLIVRIQEVDYTKAKEGFSLFDHQEPEYLFPDLVRLH